MKRCQPARHLKPVLHPIWTVLLLSLAATSLGSDKIPITDPDDLPKHTYKISVLPSELLTSDEHFAAFAEQVTSDIQADLEKYEIEDAATLQNMYGKLIRLDVLAGRFDSALENIAQLRSLEERESARAVTGLLEEAYVLAEREAGEDELRLHHLFRDHMLKTMRPLRWGGSVHEFERKRRSTQLASESMTLGVARSTMDPIAEKTGGEVTSEMAHQIIDLRFLLEVTARHKDDLIQVYDAIIRDHPAGERQDIWAERSVTLSDEQNLEPAVVAIWDTGVDTELFAGRLYVNAEETLNGEDDDRNGFVDDLHGIAFDDEGNPTPELLGALDELKSDPAQMAQHFKGFMDTQEGVQSPEASEVQALLSRSPLEASRLLEDMDLFGHYAHGTHVAGIAAEGNPLIRVLVARTPSARDPVPGEPTMEGAQKVAGIVSAVVGYFKEQGVRVVNMSRATSRARAESALKAHGIGKTDNERRKLAGEMFEIVRDALRDEIRGAPEILFVCAVDNSVKDVERDEIAPPMFDLPNLLRVAAVGRAGEQVSLTAVGKAVDVHAQGTEVESYIPGGQHLKLSGASMACAQATNLAAKLIALDSSLKPPEVIDLIKRGANISPDDKRILLINPKRSIELLAERHAEQREKRPPRTDAEPVRNGPGAG